MRAIDTNIVVRFLTQDEPDQFARALHLIEAGDIFVATTVLLETKCVLRSTYRFTARRIVQALRDFAGTIGIRVEDPDLLAGALDLAEQGMDFGDALHLGRMEGCSAFFTFDCPFAKVAARTKKIAVEQP